MYVAEMAKKIGKFLSFVKFNCWSLGIRNLAVVLLSDSFHKYDVFHESRSAKLPARGLDASCRSHAHLITSDGKTVLIHHEFDVSA